MAMDDAMYKKSEAYIKDLGKRFERATKQMSKDMAYWYTKLAENNEISYAAAKKLLAKDELEDFHITLEEYIARGEELDLNPEWRKRLVNASAKVHISRLEEMQLELQNTIENLYHDYESGVTQYLSELVPNTYYHTAYELAKGTGVATTLHKLDSEAISAYLTKPWVKDGKAFSRRIWERRDELVNTVNNQLAQLLITGKDPQKAIDTIARDFAVEKSAAGRLVMTESAALNNEARRQCMKDLDVEEYEVVATLDSKTSAICRSMDGQHFPMSQFKIGLNAPPFHCNCRSCTVPYFDDEFTQDETRAARNGKDEGYKLVDGGLTYKQWFDKYISLNRTMERRAENIGDFAQLKVPTQIKAVKATAKKYGIDITGLKFSINRDEEMLSTPMAGMADRKFPGRIVLFPNAFINEEELVKTLVHEKVHVEQIKQYTADYVDENIAKFEKEAYSVERNWWKEHGSKVR